MKMSARTVTFCCLLLVAMVTSTVSGMAVSSGKEDETDNSISGNNRNDNSNHRRLTDSSIDKLKADEVPSADSVELVREPHWWWQYRKRTGNLPTEYSDLVKDWAKSMRYSTTNIRW